MAEAIDDKTISKTNTGFPDYLDFTKLRSSAIEYLGNLTGKIWTDYNAHDPGITIIEALIYAILDLGYRTNLPAQDLFTRDPADTSVDNNFFTPSQILANNPLTITDYRKLLVDVKGVKNAWLEVEDNIDVTYCDPNSSAPDLELESFVSYQNFCDCSTLNGLYHVYVQLEDGIEENKHIYQKTISKIKDALMSHRNLCEDFIDIKVLCKLELGICVEIDLEKDADAEEVYVAIVEALQEFLSPSPKFYSLKELLDRNKPIDEIYAGRPYDITESHGFVDMDEFEKLELRKELHLSDIYQLLSQIAGVRRIRNLGWIKCCSDKKSSPEWKLVLPENYIPSFSIDCSGFIFTRNGLPENVDLKKFESYFKMKFAGAQQAWYKEPSSYFDPVILPGVYRNDLADYYSIQNEFPKVYGISAGGLGSDEPDKRKAQALQLQGFLLFFDQLLANYLTQLKNIRNLFSLTSSKDEANNHTYFINQLTNAPQLSKLLRFSTDNNILPGAEGSILAYPTSRKNLQELIDTGRLEKECDPDFPRYPFCFAQDRDLVLNQLKDDFVFADYQPIIASTARGCYYFYFFTSSDEVVLISRNFYKDGKEAALAAASVKYAASFIENYRSFITTDPNCKELFSFDIELNLNVYSKYLQLIVEDQDLYQKRRQEFLNHLLSRFAETFTDFALLTAPFVNSQSLPALKIKAEERFLSSYVDISSNRGKAYDYLRNKWNSYNISGFEKRVKALAGIENWKRHYLCNFVVEPADKLYELTVLLFELAFAVADKSFDEQSGLASLHSIFKKWLNPVFEYDYISHEQRFEVYVKDDFGNKYANDKLFPNEIDAKNFISNLDTAFKFQPNLKNDVFVNHFIYLVYLNDSQGNPLLESKRHFETNEGADYFARKISDKINSHLNNENDFVKVTNDDLHLKLIPVAIKTYPFTFINENGFMWKLTDSFHLSEERKRFSILNKEASLQFDSIQDFPDAKIAKEAFRKILRLLPLSSSYQIEKNKQSDQFEIFITDDSGKLARYFELFELYDQAQSKQRDLLQELQKATYNISLSGPIEDEWEFRYRSGDVTGNYIDYVSKGNFKSRALAEKGAQDFYSDIADLIVQLRGNQLELSSNSNPENIKVVAVLNNPTQDDLKKATALVSFSKQLYMSISDSSDKKLLSILNQGRINPGEDFIYKLVDKDNLIAFHPTLNYTQSYFNADLQKNDLIQHSLIGYNYIDITLGKDIIRERKDVKTKIIWYHYQIKCNNRKYQQGPLIGKDLVLFESVRGYTNEADAVTAFQNEYLQVLKYARNVSHYGSGQYISLTELLENSTDACCNTTSLVFIPNETNTELGGYEIQKILAPMAASYPIRYIRKNKYLFILGQLDDINRTFVIDWKSNKEYSTAEDAMFQFQFFLVLLKYPGNFYIEWCSVHCYYKIFIREVLLVSSHGFATPEDAWGEEGVEKLICISQSENGFHSYLNRLTCDPGFFVACSNMGLKHPCIYDTPERRDKVMDKLFQASAFNFMDLIQMVDAEQIILNDLNGNPLVKLNIGSNRELYLSACEWLLIFKELAYFDINYVKKGHKFSLNYRYKLKDQKQERYYVLAEPVDSNISLKAWKKEIQKIACYFPVVRSKDSCKIDGEDRFKVEIKLPGFDPCCGDILNDDPCSSPCKDPDPCAPTCYISWISDCCFDDCCQALDFYLFSMLLLKSFKNYIKVFDCDCGSYRIELHPQLTLKEENEFLKRTIEVSVQNKICNDYRKVNTESTNNKKYSRLGVLCWSNIVAFNPQYYPNPKMSCDAITRSKKLINAEGLHLVEHILLRPRCEEDHKSNTDCNCDGLPLPCSDPVYPCHFQWKPGGDPDPCKDEETICFTPGCDPYSFIATIFLPAWPERFRSESGRKIMEKLLQKEAPAHVLLRILWLRPRDFCCLEFYDKLWIEWLAHKNCNPAYSNCDFISLLFKKEFTKLPECDDCVPCDCGNEPVNSCAPELYDPCKDVNVLSKINELFCWSNDPQFVYNYCESELITKRISENNSALKTADIEAGPDNLPEIKNEGISEKVEKEIETTDQQLKAKFKFVQTRANRYAMNINALKKYYPHKEVINNALIFLKKPDPSQDDYSMIAKEILKDRSDKSKNIKGLPKNQKQALIENITWKYLDVICLNKTHPEEIYSLNTTFKYLKEKGIDMKTIYTGWECDKVKEFENGIDCKKIKKAING